MSNEATAKSLVLNQNKAINGHHPNSRANLIPVKPGEVRNPNGRPKREKLVHKDLEEVLKDPWSPRVKLMEKLRQELDLPEGTSASRLLAAWAVFGATVQGAKGNLLPFMMITDRLYGKPKESVEIEEKPAIRTITLTDQQVDVMHDVLMHLEEFTEKQTLALEDGKSNDEEMEGVVVKQEP